MARREYSEEAELRRYIWNNCGHLQTARERSLYTAAVVETKAVHATDAEMASRLRSMRIYIDDPEVKRIAADGVQQFRDQVYNRIVSEYQDRFFINRCERCSKIVASPIACTCVWCGHIWYHRRSEMEAAAFSEIYPPPETTQAEQGGGQEPLARRE